MRARTMQPTLAALQRVVVVPYDPRWPGEFALAADELVAAFGANLLTVHHIGSTAILEIHAKPIIDLLPVVKDIAAVDKQNAEMERLGYEPMREFGIAGRRYFRRFNAAGERTHHVHAYQAGSPEIDRHLAFRDFLRAHPQIAAQYSQLKRDLAAAHPHSLDAYVEGKDGFVKEMEARAMEWRAERNFR